MTESTTVASGETPTTPGSGETPTTPTNWTEWLAAQTESVRALADAHTAGLRNALDAEREQRKDLARQLRDLAPKAEKGSDLERSIADLTAKHEAAERRAAFMESAGAANCTNPRAAYLVAVAEGHFKRDGSPDWAALAAMAPELFRRATPTNAGAGTGTPPPGKASMNEFIRRAAGRG